MVEPVDYHLLKYPDRKEPENADFTSLPARSRRVTSFPGKGEWRVEQVREAHDLPNPQLVCVPA